MAERPGRGPDRQGDDQYSWLSDRQTPDSEATQAIPRTPLSADDDSTQAIPRADSGDDDATRVVPRRGETATRPAAASGGSRSGALPPPVLPPPNRGGSSAQRPPRPPRAPSGRGRTVRRVLLVLLLVWVAFLIAVPIWAWSRIEKVDAEPDTKRPEDQPGHTYLVVGSDSRQGLSEEERTELATGNAAGQRTDTIMLLHTGSGPTLLLSLPRDSPVQIPGRDTGKINSAYAFGGPRLLVRTVETNTGIAVDGYVEIGLGGFVNIVDAVGGVEVCPKAAIDDPKAGLDIKRGCQELGGPAALGYARTRATATADLQRVQNQREVVGAIADKAVSPWTVLNPWRYYQLSSAGADSLRVGEDVGPFDLARFAWAMGRVTSGGLTCTVPLASGDATWDTDLAPQMFRLVRTDRTEEIGADLCRSGGLSP
ncbi:MAG: LCP family protein [Nocardioidaceae bacterium]|nr:LCP family protein [Nocardioidaceae bacterium]